MNMQYKCFYLSTYMHTLYTYICLQHSGASVLQYRLLSRYYDSETFCTNLFNNEGSEEAVHQFKQTAGQIAV